MAAETVTVLFTDLVGSTALSTRLGPDGAEELRRAHFGLLRGAIADTSGTEVKNLGDGLMVAFASPSQALACAVAMQQAIDRHNRQAEGESLAIRIGISAGETTVEDDDYFGEPVVEASRLVGKATGGQILVADVVRIMTRGRGHDMVPLGDLDLKGLPEPVPASELRWDPIVDDTDAAPIPLQPRVATLPTVGFVGRTAERETLAVALKAALAGEGQRVALISGEGGMGKTTLAFEVARAAHGDGAVVLYGRCDEDLGIPYQPFAEALHHYAVHAPDEWLARHDTGTLSELSRLVPSLAKRLPDLPPATEREGESDLYLLFGSVSATLADMCVGAPVVLILDDLHWADKSTLQLLRVLAGGAVGRLLILGTFRDNELSAAHPLSETLAGLRRETAVERVSLHGLTDLEVVSFMEGAAGHDMDEAGLELGHAILHETDGNPFFVREVLLHLVETGAIVQEAGRWVPAVEGQQISLPESVREVVGARVARLGSAAAAVLASAAVIGQEFDLDLLCAMTELSEEQVLDALDAARIGALVAESSTAVGQFRFAHALVQHTIYEDLGPTRQARLHQRAADELEALGAEAIGDRIGELARHFLAATRPAQTDKACTYARKAGDRALAAFSYDEAVRWYSQALDAVGPSGDARARALCLVGLGEAQRSATLPEFRATLFEASRLAQELGDRELIVRAALANNRGFYGRTGVVEGPLVEVLRQALRAVGDEPTRERARLLAALAGELSFDTDVERRVTLAEEAIEAARQTNDRATLYWAITQCFFTMGTPEFADRRFALIQEAAEIADDLGETDPFAYCFGYYWLAANLVEFGEISGVDRALERFCYLIERYPTPQGRWGIGNATAWRSMLRGDLVEMERGANMAFEAATETAQPEAFSFYAAQLFIIRYFQGRMSELLPIMRQAAEGDAAIPALIPAWALGEAIAGDADLARRLLADHVRGGCVLPRDANWTTGMEAWANVAAELHDAAAAALLFEHLAPYRNLVQLSGVIALPAVALFLGRLAFVMGRHDEADSYFAQATDIHERLEAPFFLALTKVCWALALIDRDPGKARALALEALNIASGRGYGEVDSKAAEVLRRVA